MIKYWNTLSIPEWAACAIEYGDFSGLSYQETETVLQFIENLPFQAFSIQWGNDREFCNNPAFGLPCTCIDAEIYEHQQASA
jgi:hypothetical protein